MKKIKMRRTDLLFFTVIVSMFFTSFAFAAGMEQNSETAYDMMTSGAQTPQAQASSNISADELKGMKVVNQDGKDIGKIKEVRVDQDTGAVNFVILAKTKMMGLSESDYAVPIRAITVSPDQKQATLNVDESLLASAPKQATNISDKDFELQLEQHYGIAPAWKSDQGTSAPQMENEAAPQDKYQGSPPSPSPMQERNSGD